MNHSPRLRQVVHLYLCLVPLIAFVLAFAVGHVAPVIYVPIWIAHALLMVFLLWQLGVNNATGSNRNFIIAGGLFVLPWILATIFAGMGPPPFSIDGWAALASEQRARFGILVVCGASLAGAFSLCHSLAKQNQDAHYSRFALTAMLTAIPLFFVVLAFWGTLFTDTAILISKSSPRATPEWLAPLRHLTDFLTTIEVCLFYLATALLALSMKQQRWLSPTSCHIYFFISLLAVAATLLPDSVPEPLVILNYVAGIPAITMVMPYLIGLALLKKSWPENQGRS